MFRALQISNMGRPANGAVNISDDEIRSSLEKGQIRLLDERGIDVMLFSPMASAMGHHFGNALVSPRECAGELERCVRELGFVGCNLNPDPSGGFWTGPPLGDEAWYPLTQSSRTWAYRP